MYVSVLYEKRADVYRKIYLSFPSRKTPRGEIPHNLNATRHSFLAAAARPLPPPTKVVANYITTWGA